MSKADVKSAIDAAIQVWSPGADPVGFYSIADRESGWNPDAVGDRLIAPGVWEKQRSKLQAMGNPWANDSTRWGGSFGLYQLMAPYFARKWSEVGDPFLLFDPIVATVVAGRLWNKAVQLGARNTTQVRLIWAYGPKGLEHGPGSPEYDSRYDSEQKRFAKLGYSTSMADKNAGDFGYFGFGIGPTYDQDAKREQARALLGNTPSDERQDTERPHFGGFVWMLAGLGIGTAIWLTTKK